jgi:hypothetical protein
VKVNDVAFVLNGTQLTISIFAEQAFLLGDSCRSLADLASSEFAVSSLR